MRVLPPDVAAADDLAGAVWALGNFDGLHRGHQALFAAARAHAAERNVAAGVLTFEPHPAKVLNAPLAPLLILNAREKERGIAEAGMDALALERFDAAFAQLSPAEFCARVLRARLRAGGVVVGEGFRFGLHARGTADELRRAVPLVVEVPPVRQGDLLCSSSKIRELVLEGRVEAAALLLGRRYWVEGPVVHGDHRGRTIGVPTANVAVDRELLPRLGVYATVAVLDDGARVHSVTNVGLRPTFQSAADGVRFEAHLFDFAGDLYGRTLRLELVKHLREERRFASVDALKAQIAEDMAAAKSALVCSD
ncbi:MAG: riboflavin biosynthesis protein RibF [Deltaproteobacteria bacterium]|nr:riboflavin biosynthesis protein RibF [Deltaproteobacteria bacterium]